MIAKIDSLISLVKLYANSTLLRTFPQAFNMLKWLLFSSFVFLIYKTLIFKGNYRGGDKKLIELPPFFRFKVTKRLKIGSLRMSFFRVFASSSRAKVGEKHTRRQCGRKVDNRKCENYANASRKNSFKRTRKLLLNQKWGELREILSSHAATHANNAMKQHGLVGNQPHEAPETFHALFISINSSGRAWECISRTTLWAEIRI